MIYWLKYLWFKLYMNIIGAWKGFWDLVIDRHRRLPSGLPDQNGRNLVITGGNRGIGFEAVKKLLPMGFHIILGVRRTEETKKHLEKLREQGISGGSYEVIQLDLMSLESVRNFASEILRKDIPIHVLLNNAGIMFGPRKTTEDGFESQMGTNHLSHFLLTSMLLPKLKQAGSSDRHARVVNVTSAAHFVGSWLDFDDIQSEQFYCPEQAYGNSKAAQILFTKYFNEKCKNEENCFVTINAVHPGIVNTDLYVHVGYMKILAFFLMKSPEQSSDTLVHAAVGPDLEAKGGNYLENSHTARNSSFTSNLENQVKLWNKSLELCKIQDFFKAE